ncbi:MAG: GNAT family N-acetyltransferase [Yoonia sp.]|nr:GNAT family N-acetyltransferase [Yoonia sp.]MDG1864262.1 GNAT family N-acetyltransferase [Yoonia sp.]
MIRRAIPADAPAIARIWNQTIRATTITFNPTEKTLAEVAAALNDETPCFVFEHSGQVLGFARYFQFRGGEGYRFSCEHTILLANQLHGKGAGRALLAALCDHAKTAGMHTMHAAVSAENPGAVAFHTACGFTTLAVLPEVGFKFGRWIDLVLMQKRL